MTPREHCELVVAALVGPQLVDKWWTGYNKAFSKTPQQQWDEDWRVVYDYLMFHGYCT